MSEFSVNNGRKPIAPYMAIGISAVSYGISKRADIKRNLDNIEDLINGAITTVDINMPVKLVVLAEGSLTGFTDEVFDLPHKFCSEELFIDIPGPETERLGKLAKQYKTHIVVLCKARWPEVISDRYFNTLFIIGPDGTVVHKAAKNHLWCREHSCTPHDIYDRWVELFGDGIDAFYPVYKSDEIGNIGTICCSDGEYPEAVRALAFNGAEVVCRPSEAMPMTGSSYPGGGGWMIQNQGHAQFNSLYMICPNVGPVYVTPQMSHPFDVGGGRSHICDYLGNVISYNASGTNSIVAATIDIEQLRQFRTMNLNSNWTKDLRTELFKHMYDEPIHPKNLWLNDEPKTHTEVDEVYRQNIQRLIDRGTYTEPYLKFEGCRNQCEPTTVEEWREISKLWDK